MINSISLSNFQSHEHSELEFDKGVNTIIGPSDSGKTAIIRALRWLVWNRPSGEAFRSNWGGDTVVILSIGPVHPDVGLTEIYRCRSDSENIYGIGAEVLGITDKYKAIKTDVPEEIQNVLNINDVNLQMQLSRPFLLDDSPGDVAKHFNRVAHLDTIDIGMQNVQKELRKLESDISAGNVHITELEDDLEQYSHLEELEGRIVVLESLEQQRNGLAKDRAVLATLIRDLQETEAEIEQHAHIIKAEGAVNAVLKLYDQREVLEAQQDALNNIINELDEIETESMETGGYLLHLEEEFEKKFPSVCPLCGQEVKK